MLELIVVRNQIFIVIDGFFVNSLLTFDQWPYKYLLLYSWTFFTEFMNLFSFFVFFHLFWMFELPQSWMLFIRKWKNQNKSLHRPKNARPRCLVNCLKQNESVYFLTSSRLIRKMEFENLSSKYFFALGCHWTDFQKQYAKMITKNCTITYHMGSFVHHFFIFSFYGLLFRWWFFSV